METLFLEESNAAAVAGVIKHLQPWSLYTLCFTSEAIRCTTLTNHAPIMELYIHPRTLSFDTVKIPVAQQVATALGIVQESCTATEAVVALDSLHGKLDSTPIFLSHKGAFKDEWTRKWSDRGLKAFTTGAYRDLVEDCVLALGLQGVFGETHCYYSAVPLLRCHPPVPDIPDFSLGNVIRGVRKCTAKDLERAGVLTTRHSDGDRDGQGFGHPTGEINLWFQANSVATGTNSLWIDRTPWAGERSSRPLELVYGQVGVFYGNQVRLHSK